MARISVESDEEAVEYTKTMIDEHAVELWDGVRFIEHFRQLIFRSDEFLRC